MLHLATVEPDTLELLKKLMQKPYLSDFVLVGGTALALQIGHRKSIDLDLFTTAEIDTDALLAQLQADFEVVVRMQTKGSIICAIDDIKVDIIRFKYAFAYPFKVVDGIRLLTIEDIAPMKIDAIVGRGSKKDFYDLYFLLESYTLTELLDLYRVKYGHSTMFHVIKSLTWFQDADPQMLPDVLNKTISWTQVQERIAHEVAALG
jgi:Nucleotidyl transferase AbiEii toxin, Type IV TA system